jgi:hypothetical protein
MKERNVAAMNAKSTLKMTAYKAIMRYWTRKIQVYVVGFPKTGNTWYSFMLRRLLMKTYNLSDTELPKVLLHCLWSWQCWRALPTGIPVIHTTHNLPGFWDGADDSIPQYLPPFKNKKVILLIRDPKDTLVSLYYHNVYRRVPPVFQGKPPDMVHDNRYGLDAFVSYYQQWYHYKSRLADLLLVRYEDHRANPAQIVRDTAAFLGVTGLTEALLEDIVHFSSFENMKQMQQSGKSNLYPGGSHSSQKGVKTRKGKVGGYKHVLDAETVRYIDQVVTQQLPDFFGYPYSIPH